MKILSLKSKQIYDITVIKNGENPMPCPECSQDRKNKSAKSFSFNAAKGVGKCHNCLVDFIEYKPQAEIKTYKIPEWENDTKLSDKAVQWFNGRGISQNTLNYFKIYSGSEFMPQTNKNESVICFPYKRDFNLVNIKFRDGRKNFKMVSGAELIFYNIDSIIDKTSVVIVEGEIDCMSFVEAGVTNVISVPNGASGTSMDYINNCHEKLSKIEKYYIGVDNDPAGYKLREELVRRFGAENCLIISYDECKDANEYLVSHGGYDLAELVKKAKDVPISGIVYQSDIYDSIYSLYLNGLQPGLSLNIPALDQCITWETGRVAVVTGIPGHGKSEIVDYFNVRLNILHGWRVAYYSPENYPLELHYSKIASKICGKSFDSKFIGKEEFESVFSYINENFFYIYPEEVTIESILQKAKALINKHGIRVLVIDPYNKLEHTRSSGETETDYISRFLDKISLFAKQNDILIYLVAHPTKMQTSKDDRTKFEIPTLYHINGSANFYNKSDYGLVVYRDFAEQQVKIIISKVKFKHLGETGNVPFHYNSVNGRIHQPEGSPDFSNYLEKDWNKEEKIINYYETTEDVPF